MQAREKSWGKGNQKGGREREKKSLVSAKKGQRRPREIEGSNLSHQMGANGGLLRKGKGTSFGWRSVGS